MKVELKMLLTIIALFVTGPAMAQIDGPVATDDLVYCTTCHGIQLMGNPVIKAPRLSGMETWYVEQQMQNFKMKRRGLHQEDPFGYEMQPMAAALDDAQIAAAAEFTNATRSPAPPATISGDFDNGKAHYSTCAACHGVDGKGNEALGSPDLTVTNDWYLVTQLRNFRNGSRGSDPGDTYGMQMRASTQLLADDEAIMDVVAYINSLQDN